MSIVAIKSKHIIIAGIMTIISLFALKFIYKFQYIRDYRELELNEVTRATDPLLNTNSPYWVSLTNLKTIENIEKKYDVSLDDIDMQKK